MNKNSLEYSSMIAVCQNQLDISILSNELLNTMRTILPYCCVMSNEYYLKDIKPYNIIDFCNLWITSIDNVHDKCCVNFIRYIQRLPCNSINGLNIHHNYCDKNIPCEKGLQFLAEYLIVEEKPNHFKFLFDLLNDNNLINGNFSSCYNYYLNRSMDLYKRDFMNFNLFEKDNFE